ncbi:retroviral aspartyl protease, partial [Ostertagia ostertagi]
MSSTHEINPDELERLLLDENSTDEQLASMKTALEHLAKKVDSLASKELPQVRASTEIIEMRLASLRECPAQMSQGVSTRTAKQLEDLVSSRINEECDLIELELQRLKGLEQEAYACKEVVCETLALVLKARALQSDTVKQRAEQHGNVLSYKVENKAALGQAASQSKHSDGFRFQNAEAGGSGNATEIAYEQLNVSDFDHVEYHLNFDPVAAAQGKLYENGKASKVKHEISEPRLLQPEKMTDYRPRTRGSSQSSSMTFQSPGGSSCSESQIGHIFASIALPEVEVYKDPEGRSFEDFIMRFSMKYQNLRLQNKLLNHLLLSKLDGYPKAVAKALPKHIREGNFDDLVNAMRSKFEVNSSSIQMKAYMDLKRLRKSGDVTRYCLELERLTREAYPDASEEELSRTRAGELVSQLTDWPEYLQLYTTMEIAPKEAAYEMVKAMAQRCERSKEVATAMREASAGYNRSREERKRRMAGQKFRASNAENPASTPAGADDGKEARQRGNTGNPLIVHSRKKANAKEKSANANQQAGTARIFTASLKKWICGAVEAADKSELVGEQTVTEVHLLGMSRKALLDTGSQISIIPLRMLQTAWESGFDLDADVEEIPLEQKKQVFDASGNKMSFKGAIRLTLQIDSGRKERIALFVMSGGDGMIVLGTNALQKLGYGLNHQNQTTPTRFYTVVKKPRKVSEGTKKRQKESSNDCLPVTIAKRVYLRPGETKSLRIRCDGPTQEGIFWSKEHLLPDVIWKGGNQAAILPITNTFAGAKIFRVGEEVGTFEPTEVVEVQPVKYSGDMLQRTVEVTGDREEKLLRLLQSNRTSEECNEALEKLVRHYAHAFAVSEQELTQTTLVEHSIETGDAMPIRQKARPVPLGTRNERSFEPSKSSWASPIVLVQKKDGTLRLCVDYRKLNQLPPGVTNDPLGRRQPAERGEDQKKVPMLLLCLRKTLISIDHPLNLRRKCECGLFDQMAHVAIPTLKHPMARSKRVSDMFQLANVASISEEECWGDERKEEELRMKNSQFLSPYGLALAMQAHRRRCHIYSEAIEAAQGMRFEHPALFPWAVKYDVGAHITTALAMLKHINVPGSSTVAPQHVFLALPSSFGRVHTEVDYGSEMIVYVYQDWELLAQKLLEVNIVTAIILVWPDIMPSGRSMRQVLIALERHLQPGGTLLFFPSPYEDSNVTEWSKMGRVCSEFVRFMTTADRGFEAIVRDHYTEVLESAPYTHPAMCLGTDPRFKRSPFNGRQIVLFLEKLRVTIADILRLREFKAASNELKEARRAEKAARAKRRRDEFKPNFYVIADPERARHHLNISFRGPATRGSDTRESSEDPKRRRTSLQYRGQSHAYPPRSDRKFGKDRTQQPSSSRGWHR